MEGGGTRVTTATEKWRGPGHQGILLQPAGPDLMVYHAYDGATGRSALRISTLAWEDGWPRAAPEQ
jgi:arabinan endo-1,5-alpha-L-arabinosidase